MADDDKGWLMVASEQKRFAENLTIVREPEGQLHRITKAESQDIDIHTIYLEISNKVTSRDEAIMLGIQLGIHPDDVDYNVTKHDHDVRNAAYKFLRWAKENYGPVRKWQTIIEALRTLGKNTTIIELGLENKLEAAKRKEHEKHEPTTLGIQSGIHPGDIEKLETAKRKIVISDVPAEVIRPTSRITEQSSAGIFIRAGSSQTQYLDWAVLENIKKYTRESLVARCKGYLSNDWLPGDTTKSSRGHYMDLQLEQLERKRYLRAKTGTRKGIILKHTTTKEIHNFSTTRKILFTGLKLVQ